MVSFKEKKNLSKKEKRSLLLEVIEHLPVDKLHKHLYRESVFLLKWEEIDVFYSKIQKDFELVGFDLSSEKPKKVYYHAYPSFLDNLNAY